MTQPKNRPEAFAISPGSTAAASTSMTSAAGPAVRGELGAEPARGVVGGARGRDAAPRHRLEPAVRVRDRSVEDAASSSRGPEARPMAVRIVLAPVRARQRTPAPYRPARQREGSLT